MCVNCKTEVCPCSKSKAEAEKKEGKLRVDSVADLKKFTELYPKIDVLARSRP